MLKFNFEFNGTNTIVEMDKPALSDTSLAKVTKESLTKIEETTFEVENIDNKLYLSVQIRNSIKSGQRGTKLDWQYVPLPIVKRDCGLDIKRVVYGTVPTEEPVDRVVE